MARIRSIKPELLEDERTASLSHLEWRLFVSCLLLADDYGNFRATPIRVKGAALWAHPDAEVDEALFRLGEVGLLVPYRVDGQSYAHIKGWDKHQKVDHKGKPACPPPPVDQEYTAPATLSRDPRESLAPDLIGSDLIGSERSGSEGRRDTRALSASPPLPDPARALLTAEDWFELYARAWGLQYGLTVTASERDDRATGALARRLAALPEAERLAAQAISAGMLASYLANESPGLVTSRHPWHYFVDRFDGLRTPRGASRSPTAVAAGEAKQRTKAEIDRDVRATDDAIKRQRVPDDKLATPEQIAELAAHRRAQKKGAVAS